MRLPFFLWNLFRLLLGARYRRPQGTYGLPLYNITSFVALVIYPEIKAVPTRKCGIKCLEAWIDLLDYPYKIGVILAVRIYSNKVIYYFRV